jgi:hypothetical protein
MMSIRAKEGLSARLTADHYLKSHDWLAELWVKDKSAYSLLAFTEQRYLHDFFLADWPDAERLVFVEHRKRITIKQPSFPKCAGRATRKLQQEVGVARVRAATVPVAVGGATKHAKRRVVVRAAARPTTDAGRLAEGLLKAAEKLDPEDHDSRAAWAVAWRRPC